MEKLTGVWKNNFYNETVYITQVERGDEFIFLLFGYGIEREKDTESYHTFYNQGFCVIKKQALCNDCKINLEVTWGDLFISSGSEKGKVHLSRISFDKDKATLIHSESSDKTKYGCWQKV